VPLASIRVVLGTEADNHGVRNRLSRWFWCGILGELYGSTTETRFARDLEQVPAWARGEEGAPEPRTVSDAVFAESRLYSLSSRRSAAYKGIYALQVKSGAKDWMRAVAFDKVQYSTLATDIHHIFPYDWCNKNGIEPARRDSIVNKTPLAADTNRSIGGAAPSKYLERVAARAQVSPAEVDALVSTHGIDSVALRADDFDRHFAYRKDVILRLIEEAMGKQVQRETLDVDPSAIAAEYERAEDEEAEQVQIDA